MQSIVIIANIAYSIFHTFSTNPATIAPNDPAIF